MFVLVMLAISALRAQSDTTEYLFKKAKYSYIQYHFGYSPLFFSNGQTEHGFSCELIGVVFNDKVAIGFDIDGYVKNTPYTITQYPFHTSWIAMMLNVEPLIKPKKVINLSFPIKIGYGGASGYVMNSFNMLVQENPEFLVVYPSAMAWVNLFKPLSLGVGGGYRMCMNSDPSTFSNYSGGSLYATLRFKFYTKEWQEKMAQRQAEYQRMQQQPAH